MDAFMKDGRLKLERIEKYNIRVVNKMACIWT